MSRPVQEGGKDAANSVPGVLGLRHDDGSPVTLECCRTWARQAWHEQEGFKVALKAVLKEGINGDPIERAALLEGFWFASLRYHAWRGLARLARFALKVSQ